MSISRSHPSGPRSRPRWILLALTACVLVAHGFVLFGVPLSLVSLTASDNLAQWVFSTRIVPAPAPAAQVPVLHDNKRARAQGKAHKPRVVTPVQQANAPRAADELAPVDGQANEPASPQEVQPEVSPEAAQDRAADSQGLPASADGSVAAASELAGKYAIPASARIVYDVNGLVGGVSYTGSGELVWQQDGKTYDARLAIRKFFVPLRVQTSKGQITAQGLEPTRFGDRKGSEVAAHFERDAMKVVFSANTPDAPLLPEAQDQLSVFIQLGAMFGADAARYGAGSTLAFQAVGGHYSEQWSFVVDAWQDQEMAGAQVRSVKLTRNPTGEYDPRVEVWLASDIGYLPSHIRLSQKNGDFVDMSLESTHKP